jgi:hypothetical protein
VIKSCVRLLNIMAQSMPYRYSKRIRPLPTLAMYWTLLTQLHGPFILQRNPFFPKQFLSVGDWAARVS